MARITPKIVIEPKEIVACEDCPFFEEQISDSPYNYGIDSRTYYCNKLNKELESSTVIDKNCPLPIVENEKENK